MSLRTSQYQFSVVLSKSLTIDTALNSVYWKDFSDTVFYMKPEQNCNVTHVHFQVMPTYYAEGSINKIQFLFLPTVFHSEHLRRS